MRVQAEAEKAELQMVTSSVDALYQASEHQRHPVPPEEEEEDDLWWYRQLYEGMEFHDDVKGGKLDKELMIRARKAEIEFFKKLGVYSKVKTRTVDESGRHQVGGYEQRRCG